MKATYYDINGSSQGEQALPDWLFDGVVNEDVMHQVVKAYLSNQRKGTGAAKSRGMVSGGGRKPWKQKGTGRARAGTIRSGIWTGGGVIFPPVPHSWRQRVPKRVRALARRSALNSRAQGNRISLVETLDFERPKTKILKEILSNIGIEGKVLVLTNGKRENIYLSGRNLQKVIIRPFGQESVYDILWANVVLIEQKALEEAEPSQADKKASLSRSRDSSADESQEELVSMKRRKPRKPREKISAPLTTEVKEESAPIQTKPKFDTASIKLPNISELTDFLLEFDSVSDIESLRDRDGRKTAKSIYENRLVALNKDSKQENGDA